jgi:hypothetical protein
MTFKPSILNVAAGLEGTFTYMPMCTIGIWGSDGVMTKEHLFWDNQTYMNQIGLGK